MNGVSECINHSNSYSQTLASLNTGCISTAKVKSLLYQIWIVLASNVLTGKCTSSYLEFLVRALLGQVSLQDACYLQQTSPIFNEGDSSSTLLPPKTSKLEE